MYNRVNNAKRGSNTHDDLVNAENGDSSIYSETECLSLGVDVIKNASLNGIDSRATFAAGRCEDF
jgi:hypothetical protein